MTQAVRIVYAGTPDFAVPPLRALYEAGYTVVAVYTQPDRPAGRGRAQRPSPVKQLALELGISVYQPERLSSEHDVQQLRELAPDLIIVTAYGLLLPKAVLDIPRLGCINIHASLLPRWRGAAPIQRALIAGDDKTGITIMQMETGLDTGDMLMASECAIEEHDTGSSLHDKLMQLGAKLLLQCLPEFIAGRIAPVEQDDSLACYASKLSKQEAELDWSRDAHYLQRCVRAYNAWPVSYTTWKKATDAKAELLRVWQAEVIAGNSEAAPGTVLHCSKQGIDVACGKGILRLIQVQPAGKRAMSVADFTNAHDLGGQQLGID